MTTCCERIGVVDRELHEFYWNPDTPSTSVNLLEHSACPYCGAARFGLYDIDRIEQVPEHWRWACANVSRPASRRVRPLAEHVRELLGVCERSTGPAPPYCSGPARRADGSRGWVLEHQPVMEALSAFRAR
jgi:hypothetical protein